MSDLDEILGDSPKPETVPEKVEAQPEEPKPEATAEPPENPEPEPKAEEPKAEEPAEKDIPYAVFKSTREDLKGQLDEARKQIEQLSQPQAKAEPAPDMFEEPEKFQQFMANQMQQMRQSTVADVSEMAAIDQYGEDVVTEAFEAMRAAGVAEQFRNSRHPYRDIVKWHNQQKVIQEIGDDPVAYRQNLEAEIRKTVQAEIAAQQAKEMAEKSPPSMANVNGSGGQRDPGWQGPTPLDKLIGP